jgi:hypothetical protein
MNDITVRPKNLPEVRVPTGQLMKPLSRMEYVTALSSMATDLGSHAYLYSMFTLFTTVQRAELLRQTFPGGMPPNIEASYNKLTQGFSALMEQIPQETSARLLEELKRIPANVGDERLWAKMRALLGG